VYEVPNAPLPDGPFTPDWHSLERFAVPAWYEDAKFGIFIHWGPYSVPAFGNEWYSRNMYLKGTKEFDHHLATYGPQSKFGYKDFIPLFKAEHFDAGRWADLFRDAGAKYVVPVAEHHDGFAMYDTAFSRWNATQMGPCRDVLGELSVAVRERGMVFGLSNHRAEHWWFMNGGREYDSDVNDPALADFYGPAEPMSVTPSRVFKDEWLARCCELVDKYKPQLFYFDTWAERPPLKPYLRHFAAYYYNRAAQWGRGVAINYKNDMIAPGTGVIDVERGFLGDMQPTFWQTDTAVGNKSWSYLLDEEYKTADALLGTLVDTVSKNGTLLLNVGPRPDGVIPDEQANLLRAMGDWLRRNGEAIYGTRPWRVYGEGPTDVPEGHFVETRRAPFTGEDIRFTARGRHTLYATCLGPAAEAMTIRTLGSSMKLYGQRIDAVQLVETGETLQWDRRSEGLVVRLPERLRGTPFVAVKVTGASNQPLNTGLDAYGHPI
jgi:alpha-L-fucosidase